MKTIIDLKKQKAMKKIYCQDFKAYLFFLCVCNLSFPFSGLNLAKVNTTNRLNIWYKHTTY